MVTRSTPWSHGTPAWLSLDTPDLAASRAFYSELFSWDIPDESPTDGAFVVARNDGHAAAGFRATASDDSPGWTTYIGVDDIDAILAKITANGGRILQQAVANGTQARTALVQDPGGVVFGLWEAAELIGTEIANVPNSVMWNENFSPALEANKDFYKEVFGYSYSEPFPWDFGDPSTASPNYVMFAVEGADASQDFAHIAAGSFGELGYGNPVDNPLWMVTFPLPDVHAGTQKVTELGGKLINPIRASVFGDVAVVTDTHGAPFQIVTAPEATS